jgi:DNA-binding NarL/FixJ family response regulator
MELNTSNAGGREVEFTRQEIKVLKLAADGHLYKEIADNLKIAETTVKRHRQNCMSKLGIKGKQAMNRFLMKLNAQNAT